MTKRVAHGRFQNETNKQTNKQQQQQDRLYPGRENLRKRVSKDIYLHFQI